jgi:hypothetical protein
MVSTSPHLQRELEKRIQARTGRQVRGLAIELLAESIVLRGQAASYYIKQLAQHEVRDCLPHVHLENAIVVHRDGG